jgi:hypothetical protein
MKTIGDLLSRDLNRKIVEVIQVDQAGDEDLVSEITEYIATESIRDQYAHLLGAIADAPADPHDSVGVWISGFFGSGKSSFAKNLGYALQNRQVLGQDFAERFKKQIADQRVSNFLDSIITRIPTEVILFEVAKEQDTRKVTQRIAEFMYTVLLRELGYAEDFDIAELEIELEAEGKLDAFVAKCNELYQEGWQKVRKGAQKVARASRVLHEIEPATYTTTDSWAHTQKTRDAAISVKTVVERTFELVARRRPGKGIVFIIDEVGQHVARSGDKIEDLRATVEEFGKVGKSLCKARKVPAPCWIIITSQEKLEEVVAAIDSKRVEFAKLQDRFRWRVDLAPSDIREVAAKRVLAKKPEAEPVLRKLYGENQGLLNAALRLERTTRKTDIGEDDFLLFYPYPPHYIDLCIGIMSGIRLQPGAPRHYGGSNRTIIKQAYEMLVSDRTAMAEKSIRALVTLDKVFELVEGNLSNEKRSDIHEINQRFKDDREDAGWSLRVAKVICLLEFIRDLPRTEKNIAAFLVDEVGLPSPVAEVEAAVKRLNTAQFVRNTEEGWKLQTAQEKNWETERRGYLEPKPRERNEIIRKSLQDVFTEPSLRTYRYQDCRTFRISLTVEGVALGDEGDLPISMCVADDNEDLPRKIAEIRDESRQSAHENDVYWVFGLTPEIDELVAQLYASRKMAEKYDQLRAQNKISPDEATCLQDEKAAVINHQSRLRDKLIAAMEQGTSLFRGTSCDGSDLGKSLSEIIKKLLGKTIPDLYPKLEMGARPIGKDYPELLLKTADLRALPQVFYAGDNGLGLVIKDGPKCVPNPNAEICKEVYAYLGSEREYGNKESRTGKALENHFGGIGYGWELDMLRLITATLFRAGSIEATHQGTRYHNYQDPLSRRVFTNTPAFRASLFSTRQTLGLKTLTHAVQQLEELTGEEVDVEEGAIAAAFKKLAAEEMEKLLPLKALVEAHNLPVLPVVKDFQQTLSGIQSSSSDDCVRILTETGKQFQEQREHVRDLRSMLDDRAVALIREARHIVHELGPRLSGHSLFIKVQEHLDKLRELLKSEEVINQLLAVGQHARAIADIYRSAYITLFDHRRDAYQKAIDEVQNRPEWSMIPKEAADTLLGPLSSRLGQKDDRDKVEAGQSLGRSTLGEMESDITATAGLKASAIAKLQELVVKKGAAGDVKRIRVADVFNRPIQTQTDLEAALDQLRDALQKLIDEGTAIILE